MSWNDNGEGDKPGFDIGYGRPPRHTRFAKGRSGNPRGRPRQSTPQLLQPVLRLDEQPILAQVLKLAEERVPVRDGGQASQLTIREAMIKSILVSGIKGNARSQALGVELIRAADEANLRERQDDNALWRTYKDRKTRQFAEAAERGEPPPMILPHPDDIVIDDATGPRFLGPLEAEGQARMEKTIQLRDLQIMQHELDRRVADKLGTASSVKLGFAMLVAAMMDKAVPPRLRLTEEEWSRRGWRYAIMPKRVLLKSLYAAWREAGCPRPRGYVSPDLRVVERMLVRSTAYFNAALSGQIDNEAVYRGDPEQSEQALTIIAEAEQNWFASKASLTV